jgi:peptidoglycan DL-endopeptidase CwlO
MGRSAGKEVSVTSRVPALAPARTWLRRLAPVSCAALAILTVGAAWPSTAGPSTVGNAAQRSTAPAVEASLLSSSATGMLPDPRASSPPEAAITSAPGKLLAADVLIVSATSLPAGTDAAVRRVPGVVAAGLMDAARIKVNGKYVATLGVDPTTFRAFTERPTAASGAFWGSVADGGIAVSYTMGSQDKLPLDGMVQVAGRTVQSLRVGGFGTVGIGGVDAVVSTAVASSLGFPAGNAIVVSAPRATLAALVTHIKSVVPKGTLVEPLVASTTARPGTAGAATGTVSSVSSSASATGLTSSQLMAMLQAAESRLGLPYVWGAAGPTSFDCSGLVQWSFAQAGVVMPRVAADQARTGPAIPLSQAQPGDLLFYHTDPTAPDYISHVAIYLGRGWMIQAPEPGENVQVVPVALGSEFAGVVRVSPRIAAAAAASPVG